jgi:heat shock 70kDa protein 1/2/6/8
LLDGIDFYTSITRTRFETLCEDLFRRMLTPVEQVLSDAQLTVAHIHDVVLVGGSTRIPFVHHMISTFFNGRSPATGLNPDEAVARGAAIRAACLLGDPSEKLRGVELADAISLPLRCFDFYSICCSDTSICVASSREAPLLLSSSATLL